MNRREGILSLINLLFSLISEHLSYLADLLGLLFGENSGGFIMPLDIWVYPSERLEVFLYLPRALL